MVNNKNDNRVIVCASTSCQKKWVPGQPTFKSCSQCGQVKYCSKECQRNHWKQHKRACKKKAQQLQQQQQQKSINVSPQLQQQNPPPPSPQINKQQNKKQQNQSSPQPSTSSPNLSTSQPLTKQQQKQQNKKQQQNNSYGEMSKERDILKAENTEQKQKIGTLTAEIVALKKERQQTVLDMQDAKFFLEQTKRTTSKQIKTLEAFTDRLRSTLSRVEKLHESITEVKAMC